MHARRAGRAEQGSSWLHVASSWRQALELTARPLHGAVDRFRTFDVKYANVLYMPARCSRRKAAGEGGATPQRISWPIYAQLWGRRAHVRTWQAAARLLRPSTTAEFGEFHQTTRIPVCRKPSSAEKRSKDFHTDRLFFRVLKTKRQLRGSLTASGRAGGHRCARAGRTGRWT